MHGYLGSWLALLASNISVLDNTLGGIVKVGGGITYSWGVSFCIRPSDSVCWSITPPEWAPKSWKKSSNARLNGDWPSSWPVWSENWSWARFGIGLQLFVMLEVSPSAPLQFQLSSTIIASSNNSSAIFASNSAFCVSFGSLVGGYRGYNLIRLSARFRGTWNQDNEVSLTNSQEKHSFRTSEYGTARQESLCSR